MKIITKYSFQEVMLMLTSDVWQVESTRDGNFIFVQRIYRDGRKK
jgi:hypothetical protein